MKAIEARNLAPLPGDVAIRPRQPRRARSRAAPPEGDRARSVPATR